MTAPERSSSTIRAPENRHDPRWGTGIDEETVQEVLRGLRAMPKTLPPKLFYDAAGAQLFEDICALPEYYVTRTELAILATHADEIAARVGPHATLVEYGSGAGVKVRLLLDAFREPAAYVPVDISTEQLTVVARDVAREYPALEVQPLHADYTRALAIPAGGAGRRIAFFPGSTIGNFHPTEAAAFLQRIRRSVGPSGALILGVDRRKDTGTLEAAYDDAAGVTAAFNINLLRRLNRELKADFTLAHFRHRAFFNASASRIEMHLVSEVAQTVRVAGTHVAFERGESIWTESSYKYDREMLEGVTARAGFQIMELWTDPADLLWVGFLAAV